MTKVMNGTAERAAARRNAILAVAWDVFLEHGYGGASMSTIAERLGGSKGTLYNYFSSKEELFLAVARANSDALQQELMKVPPQTGDLKRDLRSFGIWMLKIVTSSQYVALYRLIIAEAQRVPAIGEMARDSRRSTVLASLSERIRAEAEAGRLRQSDPLEAAEVFWDLCSGPVQRRSLLAIEPLSDMDIEHVVDRGVAIFLVNFAAKA